jgi:CheY-like chemotaxis protein
MVQIHDVNDVTILLAEDDDGHALLVTESLRDCGVHNEVMRFRDGDEVLDFFFGDLTGRPAYEAGEAYLLLLDIRMPRVDGVTVLERLKGSPDFRKVPVVMLTTTDDPREVERCHRLGCNVYLTKPVEFAAFAETLRRLGLFILVIKVPTLEK